MRSSEMTAKHSTVQFAEHLSGSAEGVLSAEHISHSFGGHRVLDDISFDVQQGEVFGLLGPSGAGKTTLIKILTGQLRQSGGSAKLLGADTRQLSGKEYVRTGSMMDNLGLYERLSVEDNLKFFAQIFRIADESVTEAIDAVGLSDARKTPVERLSKGMKTRVCLARALLNHPDILFLDEPTSGLDPLTTRDIHTLLRERQKEGCAIFLTTHNMQEAESLCDVTALLNCGHIVEIGPPKDICRRYNHLRSLHITLTDGSKVTLPNDRTSAEKVRELLEEGRLDTIHSTEPNLEAVFIELTGKDLNNVESCAGRI